MPFIDMSFDDVQESQPAPEGEYVLRIEEAEIQESKSGKPMIRTILSFEGHPEYQRLWHYLSLPADGDEKESADYKRLLLKRFLHLFNIPVDGGFSTEDFLGATAEAFVGQETTDNGDVRNVLVVPRLRNE